MAEHLSRERISALLEDPTGLPGEAEHLAGCDECAREYEQMSRMRMALSGFTDLEPPAAEWEAIEARLGLSAPGGTSGGRPWRRMVTWPLQAAAVIALFASGLVVGQRFAAEEEGAVAPAAVAGTEGEIDPGPAMQIEPAAAYLRTVADLEQLRAGYPGTPPSPSSPEVYAERITHLDAMIDASRDALREAPEDPVLNNFLFQLVDERDDLARQLGQTLRMTAAEY